MRDNGNACWAVAKLGNLEGTKKTAFLSSLNNWHHHGPLRKRQTTNEAKLLAFFAGFRSVPTSRVGYKGVYIHSTVTAYDRSHVGLSGRSWLERPNDSPQEASDLFSRPIHNHSSIGFCRLSSLCTARALVSNSSRNIADHSPSSALSRSFLSCPVWFRFWQRNRAIHLLRLAALYFRILAVWLH